MVSSVNSNQITHSAPSDTCLHCLHIIGFNGLTEVHFIECYDNEVQIFVLFYVLSIFANVGIFLPVSCNWLVNSYTTRYQL